MKYFSIVGICFILASCASVSPEDQAKIDKMTENGNQHIAVGVKLAQHYCENKVWPSTLSELKIYPPKNKIPIPVEVDWDWLSRPEVVFEVSDAVILKTPAEQGVIEDVAFSSIHNPPVCQGNNIEIKSHINIGG